MISRCEDWLSANGVQNVTSVSREPSNYDKYGLQLFAPKPVIYLNGTPTSMWLQLGNARCIEKMQKHLNELTVKPISSGYETKPKVGKLYSVVWAQNKLFYRAQIDREIDEETYIARFVDYGNDEVVSLDQIYHLPEKHGEMFERLPPQAYNCCLKGFEYSDPSSKQDILNATSISPQNMQLFEHLLQSSTEIQPTGIFQPNPSCQYFEDQVPPYVVTLTAHIDVNRFVQVANLMKPYAPPNQGSSGLDDSYEQSSKEKENDEQVERSSWLGKDVSLIEPYIPPRLTSTAIDINTEFIENDRKIFDNEKTINSDWLESHDDTLTHISRKKYIKDEKARNGAAKKENVYTLPSRSDSYQHGELQSPWDPMKEEFLSNQNQVASDYGAVRNEDYETSDGRRICKFFRSKGVCFRGKNCEYLHIYTGSDFHSNKGEMMIVPELLENLPEVNEFIIIQLGHINNPENFFAFMPFGKLALSSYNNVVNIDKCLSDLIKNRNNILMELQLRMSRYYDSQKHNVKNDNSSYSPGEIVAVMLETGQWRRARIIDTEAHPDPFIPLISVQLVDYGDSSDVRITDIRKLDKEFLNLKFQALECKLEGIMPFQGNQWQSDSVELLKKTTEESYLIAEVKKVYSNDVLGLNVFKRGSLLNIADVLIKKRMARIAPTDNAQVSYRIPG